MSSQTAFPETPQSPPAFECLGHCELARFCDGGGMEMVWRYSLVLRLYSAHIPLVLPLYTRVRCSRFRQPFHSSCRQSNQATKTCKQRMEIRHREYRSPSVNVCPPP